MFMAAAVVRKRLFQSPLSVSSHFSHLRSALSPTNLSTSITTTASSTNRNKIKKAKQNTKAAVAAVVKRRTRSAKEFDGDALLRFGDTGSHIPVLLGEVLDVFASISLRSFVDCTLGAAGHTSAVSNSYPNFLFRLGFDLWIEMNEFGIIYLFRGYRISFKFCV